MDRSEYNAHKALKTTRPGPVFLAIREPAPGKSSREKRQPAPMGNPEKPETWAVL